MAITYINKKGKIYILRYHINDRGKKIFFMSRKKKGHLAKSMPDGYEIVETGLGQVWLLKIQEPNKLGQQPLKSRTKPAPDKQPPQDIKHCPICGVEVSWRRRRGHIRKHHPYYTPSVAIAATARKRLISQDTSRSKKRKKRRIKRRKLEVVPFECGWCYQPVYRVLQSNGYYRYYDDKELKHKHMCTRPVHWRPDKS